ncbi:MAG: RagB/SusD family nutrient uptake outer membrane protein, partial [Gemmatimonadota bacterium]
MRLRHSAPGSSRRLARLALPVLVLGLFGCDDFLTTEPKGELTTANFFTSEAQAEQATNATYAMLRDWSVHVFAYLGMTDIASDDATKGSIPADAAFLLDMDNLTFDPGNIAFSGTWTGYYQGIYRANVAIANIPDVDMDETIRDRLVGENKFLRAYYYFFLARAFGGVPLITDPLAPDEYYQERASLEDVYAQIEQDLMDAIEVLPEQSVYGAADVGRA